MAARQRELDRMAQRINAVRDRLFAAFSKCVCASVCVMCVWCLLRLSGSHGGWAGGARGSVARREGVRSTSTLEKLSN